MKEEIKKLIVENLLKLDIKDSWGYYIRANIESNTEGLLFELNEQIETYKKLNKPGMIDLLGEDCYTAIQEYFKM